MGFNFGAFAGGAATSGMNTYQMLEAIESQKKRDALIELQMQETKQNMADKAAIKGLGKETYGKIGEDTLTGIGSQQAQGLSNYGAAPRDAEFEAADRQQQLSTLSGNVDYQNRPDVQARLTQGPDKGEPVVGLPTTQEQRTALTPGIGKYTEQQAAKDYATRLKGIDFEKGLAAEKGLMDIKKGGLEIGGLERSERYAVQQETALGFQQQVLKDLAAAKGDIGSVLEKHFLPLYNENKLPGLNDGKSAKVLPSATKGGEKTIVITDKNGKQTTMPANIETLQTLTSQAQDLMMASSSPENYWKHKDQHIKERTVTAQEKHADAAVSSAAASWVNAKTNQESAKFKNEYFSALAKKLGTTKAQEAKEMIEMQADVIQKADPNISRAVAEQTAANKILNSAESKAAAVSNKDVTAWVEANGSKLTKQVNGKTVKMTPEEKFAEGMRVLTEQRKKQQGGGIPTGGGTSAAAILNSAISNSTKDPFATAD
jgi:hypothetical protein